MSILNCKQCNRVFKRTNSSLCPVCYEKFQNLYREMYVFIQEAKPILLSELAEKFHYPLPELEELFLEGKFGPGSKKIITLCHRCNRPIDFMHRKGYFCIQCGEDVEEITHQNPPTHKIPTPTLIQSKFHKSCTKEEKQTSLKDTDKETAALKTSQGFGFRRSRE